MSVSRPSRSRATGSTDPRPRPPTRRSARPAAGGPAGGRVSPPAAAPPPRTPLASAPGLVGRPGQRLALGRDGRFLAVHRLLDAGLLLRLEERVVLERVLGLVALEGQFCLEVRGLL